jgi:hypothetical protein
MQEQVSLLIKSPQSVQINLIDFLSILFGEVIQFTCSAGRAFHLLTPTLFCEQEIA